MADYREEGSPHFAQGSAGMAPSFTTLGGEDQMPGTMVRGDETTPPDVRHVAPQKSINTKALAATKYAVLTHVVDNVRSYQLLPQDLQRKVAYIKVQQAQANGVLIGPLTVVDNGGGYPINNGDPEKQITAGSPVYCKGTSATPVTVNVWVEMYDGIVSVN
jgi:hypothetical protein